MSLLRQGVIKQHKPKPSIWGQVGISLAAYSKLSPLYISCMIWCWFHCCMRWFQAEERSQREVAFSMAYASRIAKRSRKEQRIRAIDEDDDDTPKGELLFKSSIISCSRWFLNYNIEVAIFNHQVAWCLLWWFESKEKRWSYMTLDVLSETQVSVTHTKPKI